MQLSDCEVSHRHIRGHNVVVIFGPEAVNAEQLRALLEEYVEVYGPPDSMPAYASPHGCQVLDPAAAARGPLEARFAFDESAEVVLIDGLKFTPELFATLGQGTPQDFWYRVIRTDDTVTVERRHVDDLQRPQSAAPAAPVAPPSPAPAIATPVAAPTSDSPAAQAAAPAAAKKSGAKPAKD